MNIFLFEYAVNYSSKKENRNWQKSVSAGQAKIVQENCNQFISKMYYTKMLPSGQFFLFCAEKTTNADLIKKNAAGYSL